MKKTANRKKEVRDKDDLLPEYRFQRSKLKPNRFAARMAETVAVVLEPDVAAVFKSAKTVNALLRSVISTKHQSKSKRTR